MRKPHLFSSEEPWTHWGIYLPTLCGKECPNAVWVAGTDSYSDFAIIGSNICQDCIDKQNELAAEAKQLRWQYAIVDANTWGKVEALDEAV